MALMAKKTPQRSFNDVLSVLGNQRFDVAPAQEGAKRLPNAFQVRKYGCAAEIGAAPDGTVEMLSRLQGRTHEVMTGVAVLRDGDVAEALDISRVTFRAMDRAGLESYVATGEPLDKAGAYAIQGVGALLIARVEGDVYGVMGLPLGLVADLLARFGRPYRFAR